MVTPKNISQKPFSNLNFIELSSILPQYIFNNFDIERTTLSFAKMQNNLSTAKTKFQELTF